MSGVCLLAGGAVIRIAAAAFSIGWVHSIEKIPIRDSFVVEGDRLRLTESRIKGSGAGIEPADDARLVDGWYVWAPADPDRDSVVLRRSGAAGTGDWTFCAAGRCDALGTLVPAGADPVVVIACDRADRSAQPPPRR